MALTVRSSLALVAQSEQLAQESEAKRDRALGKFVEGVQKRFQSLEEENRRLREEGIGLRSRLEEKEVAHQAEIGALRELVQKMATDQEALASKVGAVEKRCSNLRGEFLSHHHPIGNITRDRLTTLPPSIAHSASGDARLDRLAQEIAEFRKDFFSHKHAARVHNGLTLCAYIEDQAAPPDEESLLQEVKILRRQAALHRHNIGYDPCPAHIIPPPGNIPRKSPGDLEKALKDLRRDFAAHTHHLGYGPSSGYGHLYTQP